MHKQFSQSWLVALLSLALVFLAVEAQTRKKDGDSAKPDQRPAQVTYNTIKIDGLDIFFREAGDPSKPTILLLHGFPTSSHMFRNLIPALADRFHLVAPDYPGFGQSSAPSVNEFNYTFDNLANVIDKFTNAVGLKQYSFLRAGLRLAGRVSPGIEKSWKSAGSDRAKRGSGRNFEKSYFKPQTYFLHWLAVVCSLP